MLNELITDKILLEIAKFLNFNQIFELKQVCKKFSQEINRNFIKCYIKKSGILFKKYFVYNNNQTEIADPDRNLKIRQFLWCLLLNIDEFKEEIYSTYIGNIKEQNIYKNILNEIEKIKQRKRSLTLTDPNLIAKLISSFEDISRDVNRTFHNDRYKSGSLRDELTRVLEAISYMKQEIGYCQGMNFIAGALICLCNCEEKGFWILLNLLNKYELNNLFIKQMPDYAVRVYQLNFYVQKYLPEIFYHFKKKKIPFDILYSKWIITIFSQYLDFDYLEIDSWKSVIKFCLILLKDLGEELIKLNLEGISDLLRHDKDYMPLHSDKTNINGFYNGSSKFKVTNTELNKLRDNYYVDLLKEKINNDRSKWCNDQIEHLQKYISEKNKIDLIVKKDISSYKISMEGIDRKYSVNFNSYQEQFEVCKSIKRKLEIIVEKNNNFEQHIIRLNRELNQMQLINSMNKLKGNDSSNNNNRSKSILSLFKYGFNNSSTSNTNKKDLIIQEINKIKKSLEISNQELYSINQYNMLEEKKYLLEMVDREKQKKKFMMEKYLILYKSKQDESLKNFCEKMKQSETFIKNHQF